VDIGAGHSSEPTDKVLIQFLVVLFFLVPRQRQGSNYKYTYHVQELQIIDPEEARQVLGQSAIQIVGLSVVVYDATQYMTVCRSENRQVSTEHPFYRNSTITTGGAKLSSASGEYTAAFSQPCHHPRLFQRVSSFR
jgi:hypothetical protein